MAISGSRQRVFNHSASNKEREASSKEEETLAMPARERVLLSSNLCTVLRVMGFFWEFSSNVLEPAFHFLSLGNTSFSCAIEMARSRKPLLTFVLSSAIPPHQRGGPQRTPASVSLPGRLEKRVCNPVYPVHLYLVPREPTDSSHPQFSPVGFHFQVVNIVVGILLTVFYMGHLDVNKSLVM